MRIAALPYVFFLFFSSTVFAQAGKDGAETISTAGVVFNRYDVLATSISAGATTLSVTNMANLAGGAAGANNPYTTSALTYGDLIMIIKMQGATIDVTNTASYGAVTADNGVGTYELVVVRGVTGNVITACSPIVNNFAVSSTQRVQVVRVPRLSSLTINSGSSLTATAWAGATGGVVAIEVAGNTVVNGTITTVGLGFRGGALDNLTTGAPSTMADYVNSNSTNGAEKGEGIAGYQADYDALGGRYNRGAAANGGGGGNGHNAGGGGGANAGAIASWNGNGNPDNSVANWTTAWNLESASFATNTSTGGGRGGYTYGSTDQNALTTGPGNSTWGGDYRRNVGGIGGRPLAYTSSTLFLGGGGGAGDANNNSGGAGGNGGGIIYLLTTGNLSGTGSITANGNNGFSSNNTHNDAPGGGGGGGAIRLNVQGTISGVSVSATGGNGGSQLITSAESEGPGGGGGGGYISVPGTPSITISITGGINGTTNSSSVSEFTPNGATRGGSGTSVTNQAYIAAPALSCGVLPLNFLSFEVEPRNSQVAIKWSTTSEINVHHFEIQLSTNQNDWKTVAQQLSVSNQGLTNVYQANIEALEGNFFVRIKSVDIDGSSQYTQVKAVKGLRASTNMFVSGSRLYLQQLPKTAKEIKIFSANGQLFLEKKTNAQTSLEVDIHAYPAGVYYLKLNASTELKQFKFIKQ